MAGVAVPLIKGAGLSDPKLTDDSAWLNWKASENYLSVVPGFSIFGWFAAV